MQMLWTRLNEAPGGKAGRAPRISAASGAAPRRKVSSWLLSARATLPPLTHLSLAPTHLPRSMWLLSAGGFRLRTLFVRRPHAAPSVQVKV